MNDAVVFAAQRARLFAIAYRMLGVRADAEDLVQDAWLRWSATPPPDLQSPQAWLVTMVTRMAIDRLRERQAERAAYAGLWLPEPHVELEQRTPETQAERASDLSLAYMWVLERLAPEERAAFLLRQVFDYDYAEVAAHLGKSEAACRQMVSRASERLQQEKARFDVPPAAHRQLLASFVQAAASGQRDAIRALLAEDVELVGDGGGKVPSFPQVVRDVERITDLYRDMAQYGVIDYRLVTVNGEAGLLRYINGKLESAQAIASDGQRITGIYAVRNPDKLAGIFDDF